MSNLEALFLLILAFIIVPILFKAKAADDLARIKKDVSKIKKDSESESLPDNSQEILTKNDVSEIKELLKELIKEIKAQKVK